MPRLPRSLSRLNGSSSRRRSGPWNELKTTGRPAVRPASRCRRRTVKSAAARSRASFRRLDQLRWCRSKNGRPTMRGGEVHQVQSLECPRNPCGTAGATSRRRRTAACGLKKSANTNDCCSSLPPTLRICSRSLNYEMLPSTLLTPLPWVPRVRNGLRRRGQPPNSREKWKGRGTLRPPLRFLPAPFPRTSLPRLRNRKRPQDHRCLHTRQLLPGQLR